MSSIRGEQQEIKPGFFSVTRNVDGGGTALAFYNATEDTQFNICYTLQDADVTVLGKTQSSDGGKYAISVYPGDTQEFVQGKWRGFKRSVSYGAPDKEWQEKQKQIKNKDIEDDEAAMRAFVKEHPKADGKYTAEYMADLCIAHKRPFFDLTFPPKATSLARNWEPQIGEFAWLRPGKYCKKEDPPALFIGGIEPNDIDQGVLGDCYLLCALACIAEFPLLVEDAFSLEQYPELGLYRVLVCKNGWWQVVIVDDFLPTKHGHPCFARNREQPNELWVSLMEKAYAKLHGSYSAIKSGDAALAIADMLGAPYKKLQHYPEWSDKSKMFKILKKADEDEHLMALGTPGKDFSAHGEHKGEKKDALAQQYEEMGLATAHAYSLISVKEPEGNQLCMIRNPWGDDKEWNGAWSDHSQLWTESIKKEVDFVAADDGTFWMQWDDVMKYFDNGSVSMVMRDWSQIRVTGNFVDGMADVMMQLTVTKNTDCYFGFHQRDARGLPSGDKDRTYAGVLLSVLHQTGDNECVAIGETAEGTYTANRDGYVSCSLAPSDRPYMVLVQPFDKSQSKSFSLSMFVRDPNAIKVIDFATNTVPQPTRFVPATKCRMSMWSKKAAANYQLRMTAPGTKGMVMHALQGESVDMKLLQGKAPAAVPRPVVTPKFADPAAMPPAAAPAKPAPKTAPAAAPAKKQPVNGKVVPNKPKPTAAPKGRIKLQLIMLAGRDLCAKDDNGLSDPYCTIKLKTPSGTKLSNDQRMETRYIKETLNPVWAEVFQFNLTGEEVLCIKCWDKDLFGHDLMGMININVADVVKGLTAGGPATIGWHKLQAPPSDVSGDLQIAFSWLL
jgi:hypothetical protein